MPQHGSDQYPRFLVPLAILPLGRKLPADKFIPCSSCRLVFLCLLPVSTETAGKGLDLRGNLSLFDVDGGELRAVGGNDGFEGLTLGKGDFDLSFRVEAVLPEAGFE